MKILHISDSHVGGEKSFNRSSLDRALQELQAKEFDLLIHSGDVTQDGKASQFRKAAEIFKDCPIPKVIIPGNHDKRSGGLPLFEEAIGPSRGVKEVNGTLVVFVDSAVNDSDIGRVGTVQFDMMKEALYSHYEDAVKIVVLHHHTVPVPRSGRERNVLSNAGDLLDLFLSSEVDLVLAGHRHFPNLYRIENTIFVNAGTVSDRKTRYGDLNSYNILRIDEDETSVKIKRVDGDVRQTVFPRSKKRIFYDFGERRARLAQLSNTYISHSRNFLESHFRNAVHYINEADVDLVLHCGGVVEEGLARNYNLAEPLLEEIEPPIVYTPAARDINYLGYRLFSEYLGEFDQSLVQDGVFLKGVSSTQYDSQVGVIGETERKNIFADMNAREEKVKVLFLHHNVLPIPHSREKGLLEDGGDLLRGAVDNGIDLILTGTSSHPFATRVNGTVVANANSVSSPYQRSLYGNSFNLIDIYQKAIVVSDINSLWGIRRILGVWSR